MKVRKMRVWNVVSVACLAVAGPAAGASLSVGQDAAQEERAARAGELEAERLAKQEERRQQQAERDRERAEREREREEERRQREEEKFEQAEEQYDEGTSALDEGEWEQAIRAFSRVCALGGRRCDGALYWKAYAQSRRGRRAEALATLAELQKAHPQSRWTADAKALEIEIGRAAGKPGAQAAEAAEGAEGEELQLLALDALMNSDPSRALPLLEELLRSQASPRVKDRALFVLSQSESARAREVLLGIARGEANPDLRRKAVRYLGMSGEAESLAALQELYAGNPEPDVRRAILEAFVIADDAKRLLAAAQAEKDPRLRRQAIERLGAVGGVAELKQLYRAEPATEVRAAVLDAFVAADAEVALIEAARGEKDPALRVKAIHNLGATGGSAASGALQQLYAAEKDGGVRRAILDAFVAADDCRGLVQVGRGEKDPALRRAVVEHLSAVECPEAADFLLEILKK
jgi:DNA polymerase III delta prime subunit